MQNQFSDPLWGYLVDLSFDLLLWHRSYSAEWENRWFHEVRTALNPALTQGWQNYLRGAIPSTPYRPSHIRAFLHVLAPYLALMCTKDRLTRKRARRLEQQARLVEQWLKLSDQRHASPQVLQIAGEIGI